MALKASDGCVIDPGNDDPPGRWCRVHPMRASRKTPKDAGATDQLKSLGSVHSPYLPLWVAAYSLFYSTSVRLQLSRCSSRTAADDNGNLIEKADAGWVGLR
jgi:hypothetical protein